jgi:hypothetical protein
VVFKVMRCVTKYSADEMLTCVVENSATCGSVEVVQVHVNKQIFSSDESIITDSLVPPQLPATRPTGTMMCH